jgi:hypothetical protein
MNDTVVIEVADHPDNDDDDDKSSLEGEEGANGNEDDDDKSSLEGEEGADGNEDDDDKSSLEGEEGADGIEDDGDDDDEDDDDKSSLEGEEGADGNEDDGDDDNDDSIISNAHEEEEDHLTPQMIQDQRLKLANQEQSPSSSKPGAHAVSPAVRTPHQQHSSPTIMTMAGLSSNINFNNNSKALLRPWLPMVKSSSMAGLSSKISININNNSKAPLLPWMTSVESSSMESSSEMSYHDTRASDVSEGIIQEIHDQRAKLRAKNMEQHPSLSSSEFSSSSSGNSISSPVKSPITPETTTSETAHEDESFMVLQATAVEEQVVVDPNIHNHDDDKDGDDVIQYAKVAKENFFSKHPMFLIATATIAVIGAITVALIYSNRNNNDNNSLTTTPTSGPTAFFWYEPPTLQECQGMASGQAAEGRMEEILDNNSNPFVFTANVTFVQARNDTDPALLVYEFEARTQHYLIPLLGGCSTDPDTCWDEYRYSMAFAIVTNATMAGSCDPPYMTKNQLNCYQIDVSLDVWLQENTSFYGSVFDNHLRTQLTDRPIGMQDFVHQMEIVRVVDPFAS